MLKKILYITSLIPKIGYWNVLYMFWYRLSIKSGLRKKKFPLGKSIIGPFFCKVKPLKNYPEEWKSKTLYKADQIIEGHLNWFHYHSIYVDGLPNWFNNPFDGSLLKNHKKHWIDLSDFDLNTGDIKILWESSRFDWLADLARAYRITGDEKYLKTGNKWLQDWSQHNPKNQGPNWKCGQETAIRVMKLITTAQLLEQDNTATNALQQLVYEHLERIAGNINYAIAQDNNHGTSEAAGLYIGATWLLKQTELSVARTKLHQWKQKGRNLLENRILKLIAPQGTFAQKSVTYHRVVVDTMSWALYAMEQYDEPAFSTQITNQLEKLGEWQYKMMASSDGNLPNIGSNDGAMFETLHSCDYRDFRPSTQLFFGVLKHQLVFSKGNYDEALYWRYPETYHNFSSLIIPRQEAEILDQQFLMVHAGDLQIYLKIPDASFRPSSNDAFHLDVWYKGKNILCDSGSYSYNAGDLSVLFRSIAAHNTLQIGEHQQMPKISRFLYGSWLQATIITPLTVNDHSIVWEGCYTDFRGNKHMRKLEVNKKKYNLIITDRVFRVSQDESLKVYWNTLHPESFSISCKTSDNEELIPEDIESSASLYYMQLQPKKTFLYKGLTSELITTIKV